jgi:hypothetical protein
MAGFHSLGMVGTIRRQLYGEFAVSNSLLPAIAEFWPSILARLQSASMSLTSVATRKVTLATKSLLGEYLVPERVGHAVGTGSTSRVQIRSRPRLKSRKGFFVFQLKGDFVRSRMYDIN